MRRARVATSKPTRRPWSERPTELSLDDFVKSVPPPGANRDVKIDFQPDVDMDALLRGRAPRAPSGTETAWLAELPTSSPTAWLNLAPPQVESDAHEPQAASRIDDTRRFFTERWGNVVVNVGTLHRTHGRWLWAAGIGAAGALLVAIV